MQIGYWGPEVSYSYIAASHYGPDKDLVGLRSFKQIIEGVEKGHIGEGILPIENSTEGAVTQAMDALMQTKVSQIRGEIILQVRHNLLGVGDSPESIKYVLSHPQALGQCREFLAHHYPNIKMVSRESTSDACEAAREKGPEYAAIADSWAAGNRGLKILHADIQDNINNQTRFVIIGRGDTVVTENDKTSIVFSFNDDSPGSLHKVLEVFAKERINLTRIESRPAKMELGKYIFYIDFHGHEKDEKIKAILKTIKQMTNKLKVFGSYPIGRVF